MMGWLSWAIFWGAAAWLLWGYAIDRREARRAARDAERRRPFWDRR